MAVIPPKSDSYRASQDVRANMSASERKKADAVTHKLNLIEKELNSAAELFRKGRKTDAARLYIACGEALQSLQAETADDPLFIEALRARV